MKQDTTMIIFYALFAMILLVVLPHAAWYFDMFEPDNIVIYGAEIGLDFLPWTTALAFEGAIAAFTHKLAQHISETSRKQRFWQRVWAYFGNIYTIALLVFLAASIIINLEHAGNFGSENVEQLEYVKIGLLGHSIVSGATLPIASILFTAVLAKMKRVESESDTVVAQLKTERTQLKKEVAALQEKLQSVGDVSTHIQWLRNGNKTKRIEAAYLLLTNGTGLNPDGKEIQGVTFAEITGTSSSLVSKTLSSISKS